MEVPDSPYYDTNFFSILRHYNTKVNVATLTIKSWTSLLTTDQVLQSPVTDSTPATLLPTRTELLHPEADWPLAWQLARMRGLPGDLTDHLFRLLHDILPTQERVARLGGNRGNREPGVCRLCQPDTPDTLSHSYLHCQNNVHAARYLLACVQQVSPNTTYEDLLLLQLDVDQQYELPLVTIIAAALKTIWDYRTQNKSV